MNRFYVLSLTVVISVALLFLMVSLQSAATTFSGRVVDETGKPVAGLQLAVPGFAVPIPQYRDEPVFLPSQQTETDEGGEFRMNDITSPAVKLRSSLSMLQTTKFALSKLRGYPSTWIDIWTILEASHLLLNPRRMLQV